LPPHLDLFSLPNARPAESYLELLLLDVMGSSCTGCLDGTSPWGGCQRCLPNMGRSPHNPRASFYRTLEVLVAHGLRPSPRLLKHLQAVRPRRFDECIRPALQPQHGSTSTVLLGVNSLGHPFAASGAQLPTATRPGAACNALHSPAALARAAGTKSPAACTHTL
jgi:hypothetical protein